jgi:ferredoxin-NADP reductase
MTTSLTRLAHTSSGPYGGMAYRDLADAENALICVGGSGITFALSLLEDAVGRAYQERARVENIVLVWYACVTRPLPCSSVR